MAETQQMLIECTQCDFSRVADPGAGDVPRAIVVRHSKETGHALTISQVE